MTPSLKVTTTLLMVLAIFIPRVVIGQNQPYFFNYQPQQQPQYQQNTYQPFTNAPPGTYYTPTFESHTPGGGGGNTELLGNYFNDGFSPAPTAPASNPLVQYPTQVTTLDGARHHLSAQPFQPVGNSIVQQTPTVPTTTTTQAFRPSPFINNHHTHIVNGLPRQQFFGNNYAFFRERHGLTLPPTTSPFLHQNTIQTVAPTAAAPSPTPTAASLSSTSPSPSASPSKTSESKPNPAVKTLALDLPSSPRPPTTQSTFLSRFPFPGPSTFSPATNQQSYKPVSTATTPTPRIFPTVSQSTTTRSPPVSFGVSPSFQFSQYFPEQDSINSNELPRQPLFQSDDDEEEEDDNYTLNNNSNNNNNYYSTQARQVQRPQQQFVSSPPVTASPVPSFTSSQQNSYIGGSVSNKNALSSKEKDEPAPVRIHNTTPIRIVFNYEQAIQALEETPGVRVVIAHTEKNNLTQDEFSTTVRPSVPAPSRALASTTPRSASSPPSYQYQSTTSRPNNYGTYRTAGPPTYRPSVTSTPRPTQPQRVSSPSRFQYQPLNIPYTTQDEGTTAAALENLALELEGRFGSTGRPSLVSQRQQQQPLYETVATVATEPTQTESPIQTFKRGGKKYLVVPSAGDKVYRAPEPRVVVNDLANIVVQTVQPGGHYSATPPSTFPRQTFREYDQVDEVGQQVDDDLRDEIEHLQQELQTTTIPTTTTTTTPPPTRRLAPHSSPQPRLRPTHAPRLLRITTYRPPFTFSSTYSTTTTTTTTTPSPPPVEEDIVEETLPEVNNQLTSEPPTSLTPRRQPPRYYYNDKSHNGLSGAHQRYEYNGIENLSASPQAQKEEQSVPERPQKVIRRRPRPRGRLIAGSPPRPVQVNGGSPIGPLGPVPGPGSLPPQLQPGPGFPQNAPFPLTAGPLGPIPPGVPLPGPVFRVGPRGRLLRRKSRPRAQLQGQQPSLAPSSEAPSTTPSLPPSPSAFPDLPPVPQNIDPSGPSDFPPVYNPTPFIPAEVPLVTTYRPGPPPNALVQQQRLVNEDEERKQDRPNAFRSRFRFAPTRPTAASSVEENDEESSSNQYESEEEAPVPQRRRFSTTTTTTEKPAERAVIADRANILQRQIRFNRNRKNQKNRNSES